MYHHLLTWQFTIIICIFSESHFPNRIAVRSRASQWAEGQLLAIFTLYARWIWFIGAENPGKMVGLIETILKFESLFYRRRCQEWLSCQKYRRSRFPRRNRCAVRAVPSFRTTIDCLRRFRKQAGLTGPLRRLRKELARSHHMTFFEGHSFRQESNPCAIFSSLIKTLHRSPLENYSRNFPAQNETASENRKLFYMVHIEFFVPAYYSIACQTSVRQYAGARQLSSEFEGDGGVLRLLHGG